MSGGLFDCIEDDMVRVDSVIDAICESGNPELTEMCHYVLNNHGKRLRPAVTILSYRALGGTDSKSIADIAASVEVIHNATLIHDDINDAGELRRGSKALYKEYSIGKSIVAGDYLYAMAFRLIGATSQQIVDFVITAAVGLAGGEFVQKDYERNVAVGEDEYLRIIGGKTSRLFEASAKCGAYHAAPGNLDAVSAMGEYAFQAGNAFQIIDDLLDVIGDINSTGKRTGNDIVDGKPTLPIIYAMSDPVVGGRVREIFEDTESDYDEAAEAIELIKKTDSVERCYVLARTFAEKAKECLAPIPDSIYKQTLCNIVDFIVSRDR